MILKVTNPFNLDSMDTGHIQNAVSCIQGCLNALLPGQSVQILISSDKIEIEDYLYELQKKEWDMASKNPSMAKLIKQKRKFLEEYKQRTRNIHNFYIVLETDNKKYSDAEIALNDLSKHFIAKLKDAEVETVVLDQKQISKVLYEKLSPSSHYTQPFDPEMDLLRWRPHTIKDHGTYLEMDDNFYAFYTISYFPERRGVAWLESVINTKVNLDLSLTFTVTDKGAQIEHINGKISELESKMLDKIPRSLERKYEKDVRSLERLLDRLEDESENLFDSTFIFSVRENSLDELRSSCKYLESNIKASRMKAKKLPHKGASLLWYTLPIGFRNPKLEKQISWPMYAELAASILPFNSPELNFNEGILYGINQKTQSPIIYDPWNRLLFINSNRAYLGTTGSGKSFAIKVEVFREWYVGESDTIIVLDPEREYNTFPVANRIVFKPGSDFCTNPFHISSAIVDTDSEDREEMDIASYLPIKTGHIKTFIRWIYPSMTELEESALSRAIRNCYEESGLWFPNQKSEWTLREMKLPEKFPTLTDLYRKLKEMGQERLCNVLEPYTYGEYASMFNGQTNWSLTPGINVLDIHELSVDVQKPAMDILLKLLWEEIKKDREQKKALYVDELGLIADERNPQVMQFVHDIFKRIRKYSGYACVATQNVEDFLAAGKWGTAILNNCNILTFMGLKENDVVQLQKSLNIGFSEKELKVIKKDKAQGHCIHVVKGKRIEMRTIATPIERQALGLKNADETVQEEKRRKQKHLTVVN